ncbi:MAG: response regulator transcription factor [Anaerolineae bacterium]
MSPPQILIIDDEPNIRFTLERALQHEGYHLDSAANGAEALQKLAEAAPSYDLLLLDLNMEPVDGMQVLQVARAHDPDIIVIILTAYASIESAISALRLGAFDYLLKPTSPAAIRQCVSNGLQQRRKAIQRRQLLAQIETLRQTLDALDADPDLPASASVEARFIRSGNLIIDRHRRQAALDDRPLDLTTAEFDLLLCLVGAAPSPLSPRDLVNRALGYDCDEREARDAIKWHIHRLRRKIEPNPTRPRYIKTVRHKGYLWSPGSKSNV